MRYVKEVRFRFNGPEARRYASFARTMLGRWLATLGPGVITGANRRTLPDGTVIEITLAAGEPTIAITTGAVEQRVTYGLDGFVVNTHDGVIGNVILTPTSVSGDYVSWFESTTARTAAAVAPFTRLYDTVYPDGLEQCGNTEWVGAGGLSVSFSGPHSRHFPDNGGYEKFVYFQGRRLFSGDTFVSGDARTAWRVFGAGLRQIGGALWLYVMHANVSVAAEWPFMLARYRLSTPTVPPYGQRVLDGTWEEVWAGNSGGVIFPTPWFFNSSCTECARLAGSPDYPNGRCDRLSVLNFADTPEMTETDYDGMNFSSFALFDPLADDDTYLIFSDRPVAVDYVGDRLAFATVDYDSRWSVTRDFSPGGEFVYNRTAQVSLRIDGGDPIAMFSANHNGFDTGGPATINARALTMRSLFFLDIRNRIAAALVSTESVGQPVVCSTEVRFGNTLLERAGFSYSGAPFAMATNTGVITPVEGFETAAPALVVPSVAFNYSSNIGQPISAAYEFTRGLLIHNDIVVYTHANFAPLAKTLGVFTWRGVWMAHKDRLCFSMPDLNGRTFNGLSGATIESRAGGTADPYIPYPSWVLRRAF